MECQMGCKRFTGGEIQHVQGCQFYPESLTKLNHDKIESLQTQLKEMTIRAENSEHNFGIEHDKLKGLKDALEIYADDKKWCCRGGNDINKHIFISFGQNGYEIAQEALDKLRENDI